MSTEYILTSHDVPMREWQLLLAQADPPAPPELSAEWIKLLMTARSFVDQAACPPPAVLVSWAGSTLAALLVIVEEADLRVALPDEQFYWHAAKELGRPVRGLHCRVPLSHVPGVVSAVGETGQVGLNEAIQGLIESAQERGLDFVQISRVDPDSALFSLLAQKCFSIAPTIPDHVLEVKWPSFDAYLDDLPRKARYNFRREMRRFRDRGCTIEIVDQPTAVLSQLYELHVDLCARHGGRPYARLGFYEQAMKTVPGFFLILAWQAGRIVGGDFLLRNGQILSCKQTALEPQVSRDCFLYANLFYADIQYAIEQQVDCVHFGLTNTWQKTRLGALPRRSVRCILPLTADLSRAAIALETQLRTRKLI